MTMQGQWNQISLGALLRIQTIINVSAWGMFMNSLLKEDTSLERDSGLSQEEMIDSNLQIIREQNPLVTMVITNGHTETKKDLLFIEFEEAIKPYDSDKVKWWPVNFKTREEFQALVESSLKKEMV